MRSLVLLETLDVRCESTRYMPPTVFSRVGACADEPEQAGIGGLVWKRYTPLRCCPAYGVMLGQT